MIDALQKWPEGSEPNETGFQLANNITDSIYSVLGNDPIRGAQFGNAMKLEATSPTRDPKHLIDNYDWAGLGPAQLVDVGGAQGHISIELAKRFGNISAIVQDMGEVMANAEAGVPPELQGRIRFMAHDMFLPQPIVGADIYLLRWILHNWSDKYCLLILRALVPALKPGAKLILMEACMPDPGEVALWREKDHRASDMTMASAFNAKERTKKEWETLITEADPRFLMEGIAEPKESALAIIKVVWNSEG
ncbi:O-methyltransferase [Hypoxylon rubiginosum]|uniref:O-methyltransferase n=1 Tax=Hypoxylon rubiginosum TaxID=110542 RepID=A0ACC0CT57_9PEZI|nr:O-methyltransferase [Hypoxylon rubiginosum]